MTRLRVPAIALLLVLTLAACDPAGSGGTAGGAAGGPVTPPSPSMAARSPGSGPPAADPSTEDPPDQPPAPLEPYRVTYGWAVPSRPARVEHPLTAPINPPPGHALPFLKVVQVGDHPGDRPAYTRMTFAFVGAYPTYEIEYMRSVPAEGTGDPIPLPGNSFLRVTFTQAQCHDDRGNVCQRPSERLGFPTLRGYGFGGDHEGYITFGLGIQAAPNSDQAIPIRVGELRRADGTFVVAVDVRRV